jgi:hypothetical protein
MASENTVPEPLIPGLDFPLAPRDQWAAALKIGF